MLIGVVSDTHGQTSYAREAARALEPFDISAVLHCGDIGGTAIIEVFRAWPTHYVLGNVDVFDRDELRHAIVSAGQTFHERFAELELGNRRVAMTHGDDQRALNGAISGGQFELVCHGHTHQWREERLGETLVLNPGALYRAHPHTLAVVDLTNLSVTRIAI